MAYVGYSGNSTHHSKNAYGRNRIGYLKTLIALIFLLSSLPAKASWLVSLERAGFFGRYSLGIGYELRETHSFEFLVGAYSNNGSDNYQLNLVYRYTRWSVPFEEASWKPVQLGIFAMRSWDNDSYFLRSPNEYPQDNYYEQTLVRFGLEVGTSLFFEKYNLAFGYRLRLLDNGIVALYNNTNKDLQYYTSSGLALRYYFR